MSSANLLTDRSAAVALAAADDLQRRAVRANVEGHPARGERLVGRGLQLLAVTGDHTAPECRAERCRSVSRLLATAAKSAVEIRGLDPALLVMDEAMRWARCLDDDQFVGYLIS